MMNLRLTDGSTTVVLSGTGAVLGCTYFPSAPEVDEQAAWGYRETVVEVCEVALAGTASALRALSNGVERLLETARRRQRQGAGARVWVEYEAINGEGYWRSEVLSGRLMWSETPGLRQLERASPRVVFSVMWTRRWFWEGALTQAALRSAGTGSPTTGYVTLYNNDDATANTNWFEVDGAQVTGALPTPARIEIRNNSGGSRGLKAVWVGNYAWMDPTNIDPIYRGSEAQSPGATGTTGATAAETLTHRWALNQPSDGALAADVDGQYVRVVVAYSALPATATLVRAVVQGGFGASYVDLAVGEQVRAAGNGVLDLGALPLPPGRSGTQNAGLFLALRMAAPTAAGDSATVDWVQVFPAGEGLIRRLEGLTSVLTVGSGDGLVDDGPEGLVYVYDSLGRYALVRGLHRPLFVWPGVTQRMRLMIGGSGAVEAGQVWQVKLWYRPRRLTV